MLGVLLVSYFFYSSHLLGVAARVTEDCSF